MRKHLLLFGLLVAGTPAFAQSGGQDTSGLGNYNFSTINGGMRTPGAKPNSDFGLGGSALEVLPGSRHPGTGRAGCRRDYACAIKG